MKSNELNSNPEKTGILLISHGSRLHYGSEVINSLAEMYRKSVEYKVGVGYMEMHEPDIHTAVAELVNGTEIDRIIVVPVFLAHGVHTKKDIPKILGIANDHEDNGHDHKKHHSGKEHNHNHHHEFEKIDFDGEIIYTDPLGDDPLVLEIIKNRVYNALND